MANISDGIDKLGAISETLNDIILTTGKQIDINNATIWNDYLHRWDNGDWEDMLAGFDAILTSQPTAVKSYHKNNYERAVVTLKKGKSTSERVLDKKANKKVAWAMIHTFREVWNTLNGKDIPNADARTQRVTEAVKQKRHKVTIEQTAEYTRTTVWHDLFEEI